MHPAFQLLHALRWAGNSLAQTLGESAPCVKKHPSTLPALIFLDVGISIISGRDEQH